MTKSNKSRKFIATSATAALVASAIVPVASAAQINDFNSISQFAQEAVQDLNDRGVIKGDQKGNFNPKNNVTRAEAAKILTSALGLEGSGSTSFTDVKTSAWYYDAIDAAVSNGIFQGQGAGKFNPSGNLTRSEAAIILVDAFGLEGTADLSQFKDSASVKSWAQEALEIAVANEVMKGDGGNLKPNASISRQEFAVMYHRTEALETTEEETVAGSVKAINNTTVEVTFEEEVTNLNDLDFAIEGLTISNKAVKQTNKKTVVLTTSAQTADVEYTVTVDGEA
ncbi:MAG: S-layer homology domain-containing protein, partial [Solibacillus sp.]